MSITRAAASIRMLNSVKAASELLKAIGMSYIPIGFPHPNNPNLQSGLPDPAFGGFMVPKGNGYGPARSAKDVCDAACFEVRGWSALAYCIQYPYHYMLHIALEM